MCASYLSVYSSKLKIYIKKKKQVDTTSHNVFVPNEKGDFFSWRVRIRHSHFIARGSFYRANRPLVERIAKRENERTEKISEKKPTRCE